MTGDEREISQYCAAAGRAATGQEEQLHGLRVVDLEDRRERRDAEQHDREQRGRRAQLRQQQLVEHQRGARRETHGDEDAHDVERQPREVMRPPHRNGYAGRNAHAFCST